MGVAVSVGCTLVTAVVFLFFTYLAGNFRTAAYLQIPYVDGAGLQERLNLSGAERRIDLLDQCRRASRMWSRRGRAAECGGAAATEAASGNDRAAAAAKEMKWDVIITDPSQGRIEATATTFWFGFKDDIVVRVTADRSGSRVDVRSLSRIGNSDVGANAKRVREYLAKIKTT